ncbi:hypothetical protein ACFCVY_07185 [Streptomyces sp. NPDC056411]|uniref:hypothetical protein n=1 Tax=Streptomyces sp. NPDC056411 TaxID=3345813 RepID=UPI0035DFA8B0
MSEDAVHLPAEWKRRAVWLGGGAAVPAAASAAIWLAWLSDRPLSNLLWVVVSTGVLGFLPMLACVRLAPLCIDARGITAGSRHVPWSDIGFATVLEDAVLAVWLRPEMSGSPEGTGTLHYLHHEKRWLGRARRAERCRTIASAIERFAPGTYVTDAAEMRQRAGL